MDPTHTNCIEVWVNYWIILLHHIKILQKFIDLLCTAYSLFVLKSYTCTQHFTNTSVFFLTCCLKCFRPVYTWIKWNFSLQKYNGYSHYCIDAFILPSISVYKSISGVTQLKFRCIWVPLIATVIIGNLLLLKQWCTWSVKVLSVCFAPHHTTSWAGTWCSTTIPGSHATACQWQRAHCPQQGLVLMSTTVPLATLSSIFTIPWPLLEILGLKPLIALHSKRMKYRNMLSW